MSFREDLATGTKFEVLAVRMLRNAGYRCALENRPYRRGTHYPDLWVYEDDGEVAVEVKYDRRSRETGNVYFELKALNDVDADVLIVFAEKDNSVFEFDLLSLMDELDALHEKNPKLCRLVNVAGDRNGNSGYVLPVSELDKLESRIHRYVTDVWGQAFKELTNA